MKTREEKLDIIKPYISDILEYDKYLKIKEFNHHYDTNIFEHCVDVAYSSYIVTKALGLDYKSTVRAAMLHDFFLYNWRTHIPEEGLHGFVHPSIAYRNAKEKFDLNKKETDIILKHMFPLTIKPPKYIESIIVCLSDKICATAEMFSYTLKLISLFSFRFRKGLMYSDFLFDFSYIFLINVGLFKTLI